MTQLNLAVWFEGCLNCWYVKFGKRDFIVDWFILGESWGIGELCSRYLWKLLFIWLCAVWYSDHPSNMNAHLHMLSCVPLCNRVWGKKMKADFSRSSKIQMNWNISISSALCVCAWAHKCGGNCFPELLAGIKGNITLLMANEDAELSSFTLLWASKPGVTLRSLFCID